MKALTTAGLTKLIQLIKSSFISVDDIVTTTTVTLADVATTGDYDDLINKPAEIPSQTGQSGKFLTTDGTNASWGTVSTVPDTDNTTVSLNSSNKLQAIGVIDKSDNNTALKYWTGTKAQYDAITTKDANTLYNITDDTDVTLSLLEILYPVGAIYIGTMSVCPLSVLGIGTWQLKATDRVLQGAGTRGSVGSTVNESLPNITGNINGVCDSNGTNGAFLIGEQEGTFADGAYKQEKVSFDASRSSSAYQDNAPVQQDAYLVNIWERIS